MIKSLFSYIQICYYIIIVEDFMKKKKNKVKINEKRLAIKMILCLVYLIVITILFTCSYRIFKEEKEIPSWSDVESVDDYTYMTIYKMSEKFAYYKDADVGIHFIIEKNKQDNGILT